MRRRKSATRVVLCGLLLAFCITVSTRTIFAQVGVTAQVYAPDKVSTSTFNCITGGNYTFINASGTDAAIFTAPPQFCSVVSTFWAQEYPKAVFEISKPPPAGKDFVGKGFDFNFQASGVSISTTSMPISITLMYSGKDIKGFDESTIAPYHREANETSWSIIPSSTVDTVNKQVTFSSMSFSSFALIAKPLPLSPSSSPQVSVPQSSGGGGGGGGGYVAAPPSAIFKGVAYPQSNVTLLENGQVAAMTQAGSDAKFEIDLSNMTPGIYNIGIWAADSSGAHSVTKSFQVSITSNATTIINGIFLAPTLGVDKTTVKKGDILTLFGSAAPAATVTIIVHSHSANDRVVNTTSGDSGIYAYHLATDNLDYGNHTASARETASDGSITTDSSLVAFTVSDKNISVPTTKLQVASSSDDLNGDGKVNIVDFSIMAYWYGRPNPPAAIDLNHDGRVDITDFSILAYYWTG